MRFKRFYIRLLSRCSKNSFAHPFCDIDDVCISLLVYLDLYTFFAIDPRNDFPFFVGPGHPAHIADLDFLSVPVSDNDIGDFINTLEFVQRPDKVFGLPFFQVPSGQINVFLGQSVFDLLDIDPDQRKLLLVKFNSDLFFQTPLYLDGSNPIYRFESSLEVFVCQIAQVKKGSLSIQSKTQYGIEGRIVAQNQGSFNLIRKKNLIKFFTQVRGSLIHICIPVELKDNIRLPRF